MAYLNSNNYLLNIVPLFNVSGSATGGVADITTLASSVDSLQTIINTTTHTASLDGIQSYSGGNVVLTGDFQVVGSLTVNNSVLGDATGAQSLVGTSFVGGATTNFVTSNTMSITPTSMTFTIENNPCMAINADGRTWISTLTVGGTPTTPPSTLMSVYGDTYTQRLYVSSTVTCESVIQFSDARFKQDIQPIQGALSTICQLQGVHYTQGGRPEYGLLAQDLLHVLPDCVDTTNPERYGIHYTQLVAMLVEAIKEIAERN